MLLTRRPWTSRSDSTGATPFHLACANGNWPVVEFLLQGKHIDCGYGINMRDNQRQTPLHYAARHGDESVVTLLLAHGANALAMSDHGDASQVQTPPRSEVCEPGSAH